MRPGKLQLHSFARLPWLVRLRDMPGQVCESDFHELCSASRRRRRARSSLWSKNSELPHAQRTLMTRLVARLIFKNALDDTKEECKLQFFTGFKDSYCGRAPVATAPAASATRTAVLQRGPHPPKVHGGVEEWRSHSGGLLDACFGKRQGAPTRSITTTLSIATMTINYYSHFYSYYHCRYHCYCCYYDAKRGVPANWKQGTATVAILLAQAPLRQGLLGIGYHTKTWLTCTVWLLAGDVRDCDSTCLGVSHVCHRQLRNVRESPEIRRSTQRHTSHFQEACHQGSIDCAPAGCRQQLRVIDVLGHVGCRLMSTHGEAAKAPVLTSSDQSCWLQSSGATDTSAPWVRG